MHFAVCEGGEGPLRARWLAIKKGFSFHLS